MSKKNFSQMGQETVNKFFSKPDLGTPITPNEQDTQDAQTVQDSVPKRVQPKPRINMAFDEDLLHYMQVMARVNGISITQYCNNLIRKDKENKHPEYTDALKFFKLEDK